MTTSLPRLLIGVALMLTVTTGGAYFVGQRVAVSADWHTVTIQRADVVSDDGSHRLLTVNVDGWAYGMEDQVDYWIDASGTVHDSEWPACLEPAQPGGGPEANPGSVTFRFAASEVSTGVINWRPVVMVDCRA